MVHHGVPVIEDDIYAELPFQGKRPKPLRAFDDSGLVVTCSSFSKTVSPGLRIGWIAPGKFHHEMRRLQLSTTMASGTLSQKIMAQYVASKSYEKNLKKLRLYCSIHVNKTAQEVLNHFPEGTRVSLPQGGYVLWVELPKKVDTIELYRKSITKKISFSPGSMFSATNQYKNFLRLNCGNIWTPRIEEGIKILGSLAKRLS
jgi:DNA-binding transcriptional MocR family regulator